MDEQLVSTALERYGLSHAPWKLIRHNENMTLNVDDRYLLRIHQHADGFSTDALYGSLDRVSLRRKELAFLTHLASRGMIVQTPVTDLSGETVTMLPGGVCATMLQWLPGHTPCEEDVPRGVYAQAGAMVARIHRAAVGFPTDGLLRYDASLCRRLLMWIEQARQDRLLTRAHADALLAACRVMENRLDGDDMTVVHADLSSSNMIVTEAGLAPIDFSLMGVGHPMLDISMLFGSVVGIEARQQVAAGYRSEGGTISFPELDVCFALNILLYIALHLNAGRDMTANLDRWHRHTFAPLAEGKRLIGDDFRMLNVSD